MAHPERLKKFCALTAYPDDGYLPLTWPHVAAFPAHMANLVDQRFPLPLPGLVHVAFRALQHRAIRADEPLTLSASLGNPRLSDKGFAFDLQTKAWVGHERVWEGAATMLRRAPKRPKNQGDNPAPASKSSIVLDDPQAEHRTWLVPARVARSFALVTGDVNPIHLTPWTAQLFGFSGVVIHGLWSATRIAGAHPEILKNPHLEFNCAFKLPITLPAEVEYRTWAEPLPSRTTQCRIVDQRGVKPHAVATLKWGAEG